MENNMSKKLRVKVTQEDIDLGKIRSCQSCPVARAISRAAPQMQNVRVGYEDFQWDFNGSWWEYDFPEKVGKFIENFDERHAVKPFSFTLYPTRAKFLGDL